MNPPSILVTGATGFVDKSLCAELLKRGRAVRVAVRSPDFRVEGAEVAVVGEIDGDTDWHAALGNVDVVIHLAAHAHILADSVVNPLAEFRKTNTAGTLKLANAAARAGVKRFIFLSSIKVNGEETSSGKPFDEQCVAAPLDPYAVSKREAEDGLRLLAQETGLELVLIRPPLVYGPGVKANFLSMIQWLYKGVPLRLGSINNQRSLISVYNLVDFIITCINHPLAANQTFLISDGEDLSTTALLRRIAKAMGVPSRLLPVAPPWLKLGATMIGKCNIYRRLCGNLQVDISKDRTMLGWTPPVSVDEGLRRTAGQYYTVYRTN